jgi:hypothetical protein
VAVAEVLHIGYSKVLATTTLIFRQANLVFLKELPINFSRVFLGWNVTDGVMPVAPLNIANRKLLNKSPYGMG